MFLKHQVGGLIWYANMLLWIMQMNIGCNNKATRAQASAHKDSQNTYAGPGNCAVITSSLKKCIVPAQLLLLSGLIKWIFDQVATYLHIKNITHLHAWGNASYLCSREPTQGMGLVTLTAPVCPSPFSRAHCFHLSSMNVLSAVLVLVGTESFSS